MPEFAPFRLGPFAMDGERAWVATILIAFLLAAELVARRRRVSSDEAWTAVLIGLAVARLGWVVMDLGAYLVRPWEIFFVWQGGFTTWVGVLASTVFVGVRRLRVGRVGRRGWRLGTVPFGAALMVGAGAALFLPAPAEIRPLEAWTAPVETWDGAMETPGSWQGEPVVINLWASWCGPCRREMPMLVEELADRRDVRLLLVSQGERRPDVAAFVRETDLPVGPVRLDPSGGLGREVGLVGLPTTLFVAADGTVARVAFGELSRARVRAETERIVRTDSVSDGDAAPLRGRAP